MHSDVVRFQVIHSFPSNEHIRFRFSCSRLRLVAKNWRPINSSNRESNTLLTSNYYMESMDDVEPSLGLPLIYPMLGGY